MRSLSRIGQMAFTVMLGAVIATGSRASNHLDTPTVIANPQADIGDVFAWTSADARHLNLVMTIVGKTFSDRIQYAFHVDSGRTVGPTNESVLISCKFYAANDIECQAGTDVARGDATQLSGLQSHRHGFRVFAGLRDDPFFNNVKGARAAYQVALAALQNGTGHDSAGCPTLDAATSHAILAQWRQTDGGPAKNFLAGWTSSALVVSIELSAVNRGGPLLAVWGTTASAERQIDRAARPLTANALLGTIAPQEVSNRLKEDYNSATPATAARFIDEIAKGLELYDGFDGKCGNQWLATETSASPPSASPPSASPPSASPDRYRPLATLLADDRLWVNSSSSTCTQLFAVELAQLSGRQDLRHDCGGRTPLYDAANVYRSLLVDGTTTSVSDGLDHDEITPSATEFPFLAAPAAPAATTNQ